MNLVASQEVKSRGTFYLWLVGPCLSSKTVDKSEQLPGPFFSRD